jgi:N-methylhydantoinase A
MGERLRIGVDIGGTFTDIVAVDEESGRYRVLKTPSTPADYRQGIRVGLERLFAESGWRPGSVELFFHGTTVATNTVLEGKGARTGLITTAGFRDVLEVGRTERSLLDLYSLSFDRPRPLVPRRLRQGVAERVGARGEVVRPLDEDGVGRALDLLLAEGIEALAIGFINAYANPVHERRAREIVALRAPGLYVSLSSEVNPQFKEYERLSTTVLSAYVGPRVSRYIAGIQEMLGALGIDATLHVMQASGGAMTAEAVQANAIRTVLSGPAGGVLGATKASAAVRAENVVTFDMGGTSTDVALVKDGRCRIVEETREGGHYLRMPMLDIHTIGAGGGSIAWIDSGGALKVGPRSAGADPGPACYGRGSEPTVTDANVVLGYIDPAYFLGGEIGLDAARAREAIGRRIAAPLGLSVEAAAAGIVRVADANMIRAIKRVSIERGHDIREFALLPFGGAGGLHAARLARELAMARVVVPLHPGVLSACGLVEADLEYQQVRTVLRRLDEVEPMALRQAFAELESAGRDQMRASGLDAASLDHRRAANLRYRKQVRQVTVELGASLADHDWIRRQFYEEHDRLYGFRTEEPIEIVDLRVATVQPLGRPVAWGVAAAAGEARKGERPAWFAEAGGFVACPVYARERLRPGTVIDGPAIVEQPETNTVVLPGQRVSVDASGTLFVAEAALHGRAEERRHG